MARPPASPEQRREQRAKIRQAAIEIHAETGLIGITARAVAKRAGISTGTLYSYFVNLHDLMRSLWIGSVAEANQQLETLVTQHTDPVDQIRVLLTAYVDFALDNPDVHRGAMLFVRPASMPGPASAPAEELPIYRLLHQAVEAGQALGTVRAGDAAEIAHVLWAGVHGALALPINIEAFQVMAQAQLAQAMIDALMASITDVTRSDPTP